MDNIILEALPESRIFYNMASVLEFLIFCGGYDCKSGAACYDLWSYNTISGVLKQYYPPTGQGYIYWYPKICTYGNKVYICDDPIIHDDNPNSNSSIFSFNVIDGNWEILYKHYEGCDDNKLPRMSIQLFFYHNESLYIYGTLLNDDLSNDLEYSGVDDNSIRNSRLVIYKFCVKRAMWSRVEQIGAKPTLRGRVPGSIFKNQYYCKVNRLYIFHHEIDTPNKFREVWIFNFCTKTWTKRET
ncbi:hypothetical protein RF11_01910 [Thelohanellus kitauei]|uniref:Uncharacterized protein n=1 Tax=Thelohanellus kitauei TaxID=669202 RepID=A0A0C2IMM1_THEKT|nr:hypothetical protein RF11_01910 [Thelohanellus kitauei]